MIAEGPQSVLLTDLYQLTMLQGYFDRGMEETAVFEFFVRKLPLQRNFLVAAGLEQALTFLENLRLTAEELERRSIHCCFRRHPKLAREVDAAQLVVKTRRKASSHFSRVRILSKASLNLEKAPAPSILLNIFIFELFSSGRPSKKVGVTFTPAFFPSARSFLTLDAVALFSRHCVNLVEFNASAFACCDQSLK